MVISFLDDDWSRPPDLPFETVNYKLATMRVLIHDGFFARSGGFSLRVESAGATVQGWTLSSQRLASQRLGS
jgi:hypothetical protein